jgi:glycopeptide antibiotics resistance protein
MTLRPDSTVDDTNLVPFRDHAWAIRCLLSDCSGITDAVYSIVVDVLGNVVVFFPIGLSLAGVLGGLPYRRRLATAIAIGAALSISIELIQLTIPSRATDVDDVLFNTTGTALGATFLIVAQHRRRRNGEW